VILFLGFDGVLHPSRGRTGEGEGFVWVDSLVQLLESYPGVRIVLSTHWVRLHGKALAAQQLCERLRSRVVGATGAQGGRSLARGLEVEGFVATNSIAPQRWVALGSDPLGWSTAGRSNLVLCDRKIGISDPDAQRRLRDRLDTIDCGQRRAPRFWATGAAR